VTAALFDDVVGQDRAIDALRGAAQRPAHAYLLTGPRGSGVEEAARSFAALLIGVADDERGLRLVRRGVHPDVVEFEPTAASYLIDYVRDRILPEAMRAPVESERKVLILFEAERLRRQRDDQVGNALLKTLEEPPARTIVVLVTSAPDDLLETIRSRCHRVDFAPLDDDVVEAALVRDGIAPADAARAAVLAGGQLARARALAGPLREMRDAFAAAPTQLDGTGATALALAQELDAAVEAAASTVTDRQRDELAEFDAEMERLGYADRDAQRLRRRIEERHKRETRRTRIDLLIEGVTAMESVYRDALAAPAPSLNADPPHVAPRAAAAALDACREAREAFPINEKGIVRLTYLLLSSPPAAAG
jgi:DNA polymerase-3 subunit delta'